MKKISLLLLFLGMVCSAQIINFPDVNFKNKLLTANTSTSSCACIGISANNCLPGVIDANGDGEIELAEALTVAILRVSGANISNLTGIEYFTNLEWLECVFNNFNTVNLSQLTNLKILQCQNSQITTLDLSNLSQLNFLDCKNNQLTSLDVTHQPLLETCFASNNHISSFDFSANTSLQRAYCDGNLEASLDFSSNPAFFDLGCRNSPNLTSIKIKNAMTQLFGPGTYYNQCWDSIPNLNYICADSNEIPTLQTYLTGCGVTQAITIDSSCPLKVVDYNLLSLKIYPNPTHNIVSVDNASYLLERIKVFNYLGQELTSSNCVNDNNPSVDLSNLPKGIYLVQLEGNDTISTHKVSKE
jgi:hypothetical protein